MLDCATPIRKVFWEAFERASLPYFSSHRFRNTLVQLGERVCRTPEHFKAWSQNLGHEQVPTIFLSYRQVGVMRQAEIMRNLGDISKSEDPDPDFAEQVWRAFEQYPHRSRTRI